MTFSEILKILRKRNNLRQQDLAGILFVDQTVVSDWESGTKYPSFENLLKLASYFEISLDELMGKKINHDIARIYNLEQKCKDGTLSLEELRKEYNLTSEQLARCLGISPRTLSNWEKNGLPNFEIYKRLFQQFDLSMDLVMELK